MRHLAYTEIKRHHTLFSQQLHPQSGSLSNDHFWLNLSRPGKIVKIATESSFFSRLHQIIISIDKQKQPPYTSIHRKQYLINNKRPTKAFGDVIGSGRTALLTLDGISAVEGRVPIIQNGQIIGAIGISGGTSQRDGQIAAAGAKVTM
jgi:hypothetical protein